MFWKDDLGDTSGAYVAGGDTSTKRVAKHPLLRHVGSWVLAFKVEDGKTAKITVDAQTGRLK